MIRVHYFVDCDLCGRKEIERPQEYAVCHESIPLPYAPTFAGMHLCPNCTQMVSDAIDKIRSEVRGKD